VVPSNGNHGKDCICRLFGVEGLPRAIFGCLFQSRFLVSQITQRPASLNPSTSVTCVIWYRRAHAGRSLSTFLAARFPTGSAVSFLAPRIVRDSDASLIFNTDVLDGGKLQTVRFAQTLGKPHLVAQLDELTQDSVV
jgi:hypothetical protein